MLSVLTTAHADERVNRLLDRGYKAFQEMKYDQAIREFDEATRLEPQNDEAYFGRGKSYAMKGNIDQAMDDILKSKQLGSAGHLRWRFRK